MKDRKVRAKNASELTKRREKPWVLLLISVVVLAKEQGKNKIIYLSRKVIIIKIFIHAELYMKNITHINIYITRLDQLVKYRVLLKMTVVNVKS